MHISANATIFSHDFWYWTEMLFWDTFCTLLVCIYIVVKTELNTPLWGPWGLISLCKHCPEAQNCQDVTKWKFAMNIWYMYLAPGEICSPELTVKMAKCGARHRTTAQSLFRLRKGVEVGGCWWARPQPLSSQLVQLSYMEQNNY